jgi:hypothetical protein
VIGQRGEKTALGENPGERERRRVEGADKQKGQRQRQRSVDQRQGEENETGGGNGRRHGKTEDTGKTIIILYTNAQSINSKLDELKVISQDLDPDIILLTET